MCLDGEATYILKKVRLEGREVREAITDILNQNILLSLEVNQAIN